MKKVVLLTGATDGIGQVTATKLVKAGHHVLVHGRSEDKLQKTNSLLESLPGDGGVETYRADLSSLKAVKLLADEILTKHSRLDAIINNAGVLKAPVTTTEDGLDIRYVVNTIAPYLLSTNLQTCLDSTSRVVNISSAAQASFNLADLAKSSGLSDMEVYAQSKLAIIMWSNALATRHPDGPAYISINPGSLLASKMVKEGFGIDGKSLDIGADILCSAAFDDKFASASGKYFDNDSQRFTNPLSEAMDPAKCNELVRELDSIISKHS